MRLIPIRLSLCDDCCCGTQRKHPGIDHAGIRDRLGDAAASTGGRSRSVGCLGACERSNVVVVKTPHAGSFWVGEVLDEPLVAVLEAWIRKGAPLPVPAEVAQHLFDRTELSDDPVVEFVSFGGALSHEIPSSRGAVRR
jgi:hypothetical protein